MGKEDIMPVTLVKPFAVDYNDIGTKTYVLDFDLGMDEAIRILGVQISGKQTHDQDQGQSVHAAMSFDPSKTGILGLDPDLFCRYMYWSSAVGIAGFSVGMDNVFYDFSGMMMITVRNLAFLVNTLTVMPGYIDGFVYYYKFVPGMLELSMLIAYRR